MERFTTLTGLAAPLDRPDVDTDQIIPKQFLKRIERTGYGQFLFYDWRFDANGLPRPEFVFNAPAYQGAKILIAGRNFGCGSSREHAPWALQDFGIRAIVASSFADIFQSNCFQIGLLPVALSPEDVGRLMTLASEGSRYELTIDLERLEVKDDRGFLVSFEVDPFRRECLLNGWDDISLTLRHEADISAYESGRGL